MINKKNLLRHHGFSFLMVLTLLDRYGNEISVCQTVYVKMSIKSCLTSFWNAENETPTSPIRQVTVGELTEVCAVVEVGAADEDSSISSTKVSYPLQDSHVSSYSGRGFFYFRWNYKEVNCNKTLSSTSFPQQIVTQRAQTVKMTWCR